MAQMDMKRYAPIGATRRQGTAVFDSLVSGNSMFKKIVKLTAIVYAAFAIRDRNVLHALGYDYSVRTSVNVNMKLSTVSPSAIEIGMPVNISAAGLKELLRPAVIPRGGDAFTAAKLRDVLLAPQALCGSSLQPSTAGVSDAECPS